MKSNQFNNFVSLSITLVILFILLINGLCGFAQSTNSVNNNVNVVSNSSIEDFRYFRLTVNGNGYYNEIVFGFDSRTSMGFDDYDAIKFPYTTPGVPDLSAEWDDTSYQNMFIPPIAQKKISIPLKLNCTTSGNFTFNFTQWTQNIYGSEVYLLDKFNNRKTNIADTAYSFYFNDSLNNTNRFELQIEPGIGVSVRNNDCVANNGSLVVRPYNNVAYEYTVLDQNMDTVIVNKNISLVNQVDLLPGNYTLVFRKNEIGSIVYTESIVISDIGFIKAQSNIEDDLIITPNNSSVELVNMSNASDSYWLIDNAINYSTTVNFVPENDSENHIFLIANSEACSDTLDILVKAMDLTSVKSVNGNSGFVLKTLATNSYQLENNNKVKDNYSLAIYNQSGQLVNTTKADFNNGNAVEITRGDMANGNYFLIISDATNSSRFNLIFY